MFYLSKKFPRNKIIGIEPYKNGLANVSDYCIKHKINNIYLYPFVFDKFKEKYKNYLFEKCYIFFPDPWPKKKHQKRRLVNHQFLIDIVSHSNLKGQIYFGTDNQEYFNDVKFHAKKLKKEYKINIKCFKKTPTTITKYHNRALKLKNKVNFLKIEKL